MSQAIVCAAPPTMQPGKTGRQAEGSRVEKAAAARQTARRSGVANASAQAFRLLPRHARTQRRRIKQGAQGARPYGAA